MTNDKEEIGRCWSTWETNTSNPSAVLHRCDLLIGHAEWHRTEGMQWSHGVSMLAPPPVTTHDLPALT